MGTAALTVFGGYLMQEFDDSQGDCIYKIEEQIWVIHSKSKMIKYHKQHIARFTPADPFSSI